MFGEHERPYLESPRSILRFGEEIEDIKKELKNNIEIKIKNIKDLHIQDSTNKSLMEILNILEGNTEKKHIYERDITDIAGIEIPYPSEDKIVKNLLPTERQIYYRNIKSLRQFCRIYSRSDILFQRTRKIKPVSLEGSEYIIKNATKLKGKYAPENKEGRYVNKENISDNYRG